MASTFINILFSPILFYFFSTSLFAYARNTRHHFTSPKQQAKMIKRSLNFNISTIKDNPSAPRLIEKEFKFPSLHTYYPSVQRLGHHVGYYRLPNTRDARMFYYFFESRASKDDPVVIWLSGGPGLSCSIALFHGNGPFHINEDFSLEWNNYGWDKVSNILYVDQPIGTGFSYTTNDIDLRDNQNDISNDLYNFLQEFFTARPRLAKNDFFIIGQSYAGHYAPILASRIKHGNEKKEGFHINLEGFAIGNGFTNPKIQYRALPDYALFNNLITKSDYLRIMEMVTVCESFIDACVMDGEDACLDAHDHCNSILSEILHIDENINYYDIRKKRVGLLNYNFSNIETFLNMQSVKEALGVEKPFVSFSKPVYEALKGDCVKNFDGGIPALLDDGIKLLIYVGDQDLMCDWIGNLRWVLKLSWSSKEEFARSSVIPFVDDDDEQAGLMTKYGPLTFIKIFQAGHTVPMDKPKTALHVIQSWMLGNLTDHQFK